MRKIKDGNKISILGREYTIKYVKEDINKNTVILRDGYILVYRNGRKHSEVIIKWLKSIARKYIEKKIAEVNTAYDFDYNRLAIKDTTSRWGSCSSKKNLNFSWRLVCAPIEVFDYVIIHELCHLKEMNHSANFWAWVARLMPEYRQKRMWLRRNGQELF